MVGVERRREERWGGVGGNSRGRPQDEHPDGPPLFVRVLGTSLRPGGTQGGVIHSPREAGLGLPGTRSAANQSSDRGGRGEGEGQRRITRRDAKIGWSLTGSTRTSESSGWFCLSWNLERSQSVIDPSQSFLPSRFE